MSAKNNPILKVESFSREKLIDLVKRLLKEREKFEKEREKALIDSALFKTASFSEVAGIVKEHITEINTDILAKYILRANNKALIKRFGYLLDSIGISLYDKLKKAIDYKYVSFDYAMKSKGKKDKKWRVIVNAEP